MAEQLELIKKNNQWEWSASIGMFYENSSILLFGGQFIDQDETNRTVLPRGATRTTPDIETDFFFVESKSFGRCGRFKIRCSRLNEENKFQQDKEKPIVYAMWHHMVETKKAKNLDDLESMLRKKTSYCIVMTLKELEPYILRGSRCTDKSGVYYNFSPVAARDALCPIFIRRKIRTMQFKMFTSSAALALIQKSTTIVTDEYPF